MDKQYTFKQNVVFVVFLAVVQLAITGVLAAGHTITLERLKFYLVLGDSILFIAASSVLSSVIRNPDCEDPMREHKATLAGIAPLFMGAIVAVINFAIGYNIFL